MRAGSHTVYSTGCHCLVDLGARRVWYGVPESAPGVPVRASVRPDHRWRVPAKSEHSDFVPWHRPTATPEIAAGATEQPVSARTQLWYGPVEHTQGATGSNDLLCTPDLPKFTDRASTADSLKYPYC